MSTVAPGNLGRRNKDFSTFRARDLTVHARMEVGLKGSPLITRTSAVLLAFGGIALLFMPDSILPVLAPGIPDTATWPGQLVGAGWLAIAALNWLNKRTLIGGIYGRPLVLANLILYFISTMVLLRALRDAATAPALWWLAVPVVVMTVVYGVVLFKGPFDSRR